MKNVDNAAGLIYYRNANTSLINKEVSKNSAKTDGVLDQ